MIEPPPTPTPHPLLTHQCICGPHTHFSQSMEDSFSLQKPAAYSHTELRSCVKVEVTLVGSPSLIVLIVSMDVDRFLYFWTFFFSMDVDRFLYFGGFFFFFLLLLLFYIYIYFFIYSAILRSEADSLRLHVILHE